jgi:hypothetical protein
MRFVKKREIPLGEAKFLTVVSPDEPDITELLLEPNNNSAAKTYQKAIFEQNTSNGILKHSNGN